MPLFKFSSVSTDTNIAQLQAEVPFLESQLEAVEIGLFAEIPFTEVQLDSSVVGLTATIEAEGVFVDALFYGAADVFCMIPFFEVLIRERDVAYIAESIPFYSVEIAASVSGAASIQAVLPRIDALVLHPNFIEAIAPSQVGIALGTTTLTADASAIIPEQECIASTSVQANGMVVAELPFILSSLVAEPVGILVNVVAEIPFMLTRVRGVPSGSFDYGTEEDAVLRHSYSRRYI
jgi:hypothetical protein